MGDLSPHFSRREFACNHCGEVRITPGLVDALEKLRAAGYADIGLGIISGYRCATHNARVGGSSKSQHMVGSAVDIRARMTLSAVRSLGVFSGIGWGWYGRWPRRRKLGRHVDVRHLNRATNYSAGTTRHPAIWRY